MKLSAILEDDENIVVVPLIWLKREDRQKFIRNGYEVIPIPGYRETAGLRAYKIIGPYSQQIWQIHKLSIPIWEDWKLTAQYANDIEIDYSTTGSQMFDRLDDDEKIEAFTYSWYDKDYIVKYFLEHPDLLKRAKRSLKLDDINYYYTDLFVK